MTKVIQCHALIFQTLEDLKAACIEAADETSQVKDFEAGVFCGQYQTPVPADYQTTALMDEGDSRVILVASSGPVNGLVHDGKGLEYREDIKYSHPYIKLTSED